MNCFLTAAIDTAALLSESGMTVLIGFCVVFAALLLLTFVFWIFGVVARGKSEGSTETPKIIPTPVSAPAAPVVEDGVPEEVVAVIAAAVAAMSDGNTRYAVRRIRAARTATRPVWAAAGIAENTQPF
ncbi:MAG: OadG family protein [Clostridia bacterium]|nr:OadG family protein [Clostridia bacterium]